MFKNLFNRNGKTNTFNQTKKIIEGDNNLTNRIKELFEEKENSKIANEIEFIPPNLLTEEDIMNLPNITDWDTLVDMKSRTRWIQSEYKSEIIEQRMFEILPDKLSTIGKTIDDVKELLQIDHDIGYNKEFNKSIEEKLLSILELILPQINDIHLLSSWYDRMHSFSDKILETMVETRLKEIIWPMNKLQRIMARNSITKFPNVISDLIYKRDLEFVLEKKKRHEAYIFWDNSDLLLNQSIRSETAKGIHKLIKDREIIFTSKDISNITKKLKNNQTIISTQINEALLSYLSDTIN